MKIKELKKLEKLVGKASAFAEEIKTKVNNDLEVLRELDTTVKENLSFLQDLNIQVEDASKILEKLANLIS